MRYCRIERSWTTPSPGAVTELLRAWGDGDDGALEQLTPLVEAELRRLARGYMAPRAARPHVADHGAGERGVSPTDRRPARPLAGPRALSRDFGPPDAARARRSRAVARVSQTRRRRTAGDAGRRARRVAGTGVGRRGVGSRLGGIGGGRRSEEPGRSNCGSSVA